MMRIKLVTLITIFMLGCAEVRVRTSYDKTVDFTEYKTWCWLKGCDLVYQGPNYLYDSAVIEDIGNAIAVEMYEKGYKQVDDSSDILVDFHIVMQPDSARAARVHEEDLPFWDLYEEDYYHFIRGSLIIDVADRRKGRMIWRSNSKSVLPLRPKIELDDIRKGVKKAMKKFPPESEEQLASVKEE